MPYVSSEAHVEYHYLACLCRDMKTTADNRKFSVFAKTVLEARDDFALEITKITF